MSGNNNQAMLCEIKKSFRRNWFKPERVEIYADSKCPYCDKDRLIHATAANGQELVDYCRCGERKESVWTVNPYEVEAFVIPDDETAIEVLPAKLSETDGTIIMSWFADPSPDGREAPKLLLYNSLFSSIDKFEDYCRKAGIKTLPIEDPKV